MARSLNKATLIGNLGSDPEIRVTNSGQKVAQFSMATSRQWTDRNGEAQERTEWHRIVAWGRSPDKDGLAGVAERYLKKGARLYVEGEIQYRQYEDRDGNTRYITEIVASDLLMLGGADSDGERRSGRGESAGRESVSTPGGRQESGRHYDDDLPF